MNGGKFRSILTISLFTVAGFVAGVLVWILWELASSYNDSILSYLVSLGGQPLYNFLADEFWGSGLYYFLQVMRFMSGSLIIVLVLFFAGVISSKAKLVPQWNYSLRKVAVVGTIMFTAFFFVAIVCVLGIAEGLRITGLFEWIDPLDAWIRDLDSQYSIIFKTVLMGTFIGFFGTILAGSKFLPWFAVLGVEIRKNIRFVLSLCIFVGFLEVLMFIYSSGLVYLAMLSRIDRLFILDAPLAGFTLGILLVRGLLDSTPNSNTAVATSPW